MGRILGITPAEAAYFEYYFLLLLLTVANIKQQMSFTHSFCLTIIPQIILFISFPFIVSLVVTTYCPVVVSPVGAIISMKIEALFYSLLKPQHLYKYLSYSWL